MEVYNHYTECGGLVLLRQDLVSKLANQFRKGLVILSSPGLPDILAFRTHAAGILKLCQDDNENSQDVSKVAKCIRKEIKDKSIVKYRYAKRINKCSASEHISDSLKALLREISDDLCEEKLPAILIGNIVTSILSKKPSDLLIDLGILLRDKKLIEHLYDYCVVCLYDEVKRFKSSAGLDNYKNANCVLRGHVEGLVQAVADNFDTDISSQNGKMETHSLPLFMTQPIIENGTFDGEIETFTRLKKSDIKDKAIPDTSIHGYTGPKKPKMSPEKVKPGVFSKTMIEKQVTIKEISQELDLEFFQAIATNSSIPEYSGYNTKERREK